MQIKERVISLDTETTGLDAANGDRIVEIGAVEIVGGMETGRTWHRYINPYPQRVHPDAFAVHRLSDEFLMDKPKFREVVDDFLEFIGDSPLVIHNAPFDTGFLNAELERANRGRLRNEIRDTLKIARERFPAQRNTLDALCERFDVDNSTRIYHGALIDASLLAEVYIKMSGLHMLALDAAPAPQSQAAPSRPAPGEPSAYLSVPRRPRAPRAPLLPTAEEAAAHQAFIAAAVKDSLWQAA